MPIFIIAAIVIAFIAIAFALLNNQSILVNLLFSRLEGSLAIILLSTLAIGVLIGILVLIPTLIKRGWRISRLTRQTADLEQELTTRDRSLTDQTRNTDQLRQSHENLLLAMGLIDVNTGLLNAETLTQALTALIKQMKLQPGNPQFDSIGLLIVDAKRQTTLGEIQTTERQNALLDNAIAHTIRQSVTLDTWLYCDSRDANGAQFMCVLTGMGKADLKQYGEAMRAALTDEPLKLSDDSVVAVETKVGGAVADRNHPTNQAQIIIDKAYQALADTGKRSMNPMAGSHSVKVMQVTDS